MLWTEMKPDELFECCAPRAPEIRLRFTFLRSPGQQSSNQR